MSHDDTEALVLFAVIFFWTPPHYWPLSMKHRADYQAANVSMLGAVAPALTVSRRIIAYTWVMVRCTLLMVPIAGAGIVYTATAVISGAWFLSETYRLHRRAHGGHSKTATPCEPSAHR